jgi:hypothetical protein
MKTYTNAAGKAFEQASPLPEGWRLQVSEGQLVISGAYVHISIHEGQTVRQAHITTTGFGMRAEEANLRKLEQAAREFAQASSILTSLHVAIATQP